MPTVVETPKHLRPFTFHGMDLSWTEDGGQARSTCPFCDKDKWYVSLEDGLWDCKVCGAKGNPLEFIRQLWEISDKTTTDYDDLRESRRLLYPETAMYWGATTSVITGEWLLAGYSPDGRLFQLYRYSKEYKTGTRILKATPNFHHAVHGVPLSNPHHSTVYVCEGPWDGMVLWELMRSLKDDGEGKYVLTGSEENSLLKDAFILAVPGCNVFSETWLPLFSDKTVVLLYDNDHPSKQGKPGWDGMRRASGILARSEGAKEIRCLHWGRDGYDPNLPSGYDIRDWLTQGTTVQERSVYLRELLEKIHPIPGDWVAGRSLATRRSGGTDMEALECGDWTTLIKSWRRAMKWTPGLDKALAVMLACVTSVKAVGDQLWCKVIGPASCGKSTLCEALSVNKKHITAKSTIRGFHSGYKTDRDGAEDNSLAVTLYDKTLITKDGDTLLQAPNLSQILSEARDIYDGTSRTHYRNRMGRDYQGLRMTWILCGTSSLRQLDASELGERFLDCVIMDSIDDDLEDEILWRVVNRAERNMNQEANGAIETQHDPDMAKAMQLTGGYVDYLRDNAIELLGKIHTSDEAKRRCMDLGKFVAYMRARPSKKQDEMAEREFSARLVIQMMRLSKCLAVVLNKAEIDNEVMERTRSVALDTARGISLEVAKVIHSAGEDGMPFATLNRTVTYPEGALRSLLIFLRRIGALEYLTKQGRDASYLLQKPRWRLTPKLVKLYGRVMNATGVK